jgi:hypothetical protein
MGGVTMTEEEKIDEVEEKEPVEVETKEEQEKEDAENESQSTDIAELKEVIEDLLTRVEQLESVRPEVQPESVTDTIQPELDPTEADQTKDEDLLDEIEEYLDV